MPWAAGRNSSGGRRRVSPTSPRLSAPGAERDCGRVRLPWHDGSAEMAGEAMNWDYFFVQFANGAVIGIIYAMIAVGVTLIFSILKIVNFAHGDLYMLGGYCSYYVNL